MIRLIVLLIISIKIEKKLIRLNILVVRQMKVIPYNLLVILRIKIKKWRYEINLQGRKHIEHS